MASAYDGRLREGKYEVVQSSGLIDCSRGALARQLLQLDARADTFAGLASISGLPLGLHI